MLSSIIIRQRVNGKSGSSARPSRTGSSTGTWKSSDKSCGGSAVSSSNPTIPIVFENRTSNRVFVQFLNGSFGSGQYGGNGTVLLAGDTSYDIATLSSSLPSFPALGNIPNV